MWFTEVAEYENPGPEQLIAFLGNVQSFFQFVLFESKDFGFLWRDDQDLRNVALETFRKDVTESVSLLQRVVPNISATQIFVHGLSGRPLRFKFAVADEIGRRWGTIRGNMDPRDWLKRMFDAIDAILDSLIDAAGGAGGLIKEFKDALRALA